MFEPSGIRTTATDSGHSGSDGSFDSNLQDENTPDADDERDASASDGDVPSFEDADPDFLVESDADETEPDSGFDADVDEDADEEVEPGCTFDLECSDPTPVCDLETGECVQCLSESDCPSGIHSHAVCTEGTCELECQLNWGDCDSRPESGCEVYLINNDDHCGRCDNRCPSSFECVENACKKD